MARNRSGNEFARGKPARTGRVRKAARLAPPPGTKFARRRATRLFYGAGLCLALAAIAHASCGFLLQTPYLQLSQIQVVGVSDSLKQEILKATQSLLESNRSILSLDVGNLAKEISKHPRIENLHLDKKFPNTLLIKANEREPAAIVNTGGNFYLVDNESSVMQKLKASDLSSYDFPYITGILSDEVNVGDKIHDAAFYPAMDLIRALHDHNPDLYLRFSEVNAGTDPVAHMDNLTAYLKGGMQVRFGNTKPVEKLPALDLFIDMMRKQNIDPFKMAYVDLRFKDQIVYKDRATEMAEIEGKSIDVPVQGAADKDSATKAEKESGDSHRKQAKSPEKKDRNDNDAASDSTNNSSPRSRAR